MKNAIPFAIVLLTIANSVCTGQYSIVRHFGPQTLSPRSTGVYEGRVYGITDIFGDQTHPFGVGADLFSFNLDNSDFKSRNVITELGGFGPREIAAGPLTFDQNRLYGVQDLGIPYFAEVSDLIPTRYDGRFNQNWFNPVIVEDSYLYGATNGFEYGVGRGPLAGGPTTSTLFTDTPINTVATDGANIFAASLGLPNLFDGKVVVISETGAVKILYSNDSSTYGLAYSDSQLYGIGDDGLFKVNIDGSGFEFLKTDIVGTRIIVEEDTIYGVARPTYVAPDQKEQLFEIKTDGAGFRSLHEFGSIVEDGSSLNSDLVLIGNSLFGSTYEGGKSGKGTFYRYDLNTSQNVVPEPASMITWLILICGSLAYRWCRVRKGTGL